MEICVVFRHSSTELLSGNRRRLCEALVGQRRWGLRARICRLSICGLGTRFGGMLFCQSRFSKSGMSANAAHSETDIVGSSICGIESQTPWNLVGILERFEQLYRFIPLEFLATKKLNLLEIASGILRYIALVERSATCKTENFKYLDQDDICSRFSKRNSHSLTNSPRASRNQSRLSFQRKQFHN
jgi:hypothetical protein